MGIKQGQHKTERPVVNSVGIITVKADWGLLHSESKENAGN